MKFIILVSSFIFVWNIFAFGSPIDDNFHSFTVDAPTFKGAFIEYSGGFEANFVCQAYLGSGQKLAFSEVKKTKRIDGKIKTVVGIAGDSSVGFKIYTLNSPSTSNFILQTIQCYTQK